MEQILYLSCLFKIKKIGFYPLVFQFSLIWTQTKKSWISSNIKITNKRFWQQFPAGCQEGTKGQMALILVAKWGKWTKLELFILFAHLKFWNVIYLALTWEDDCTHPGARPEWVKKLKSCVKWLLHRDIKIISLYLS